ncbi:MAG: DUF4395 domain-containing protein [Bacteroidetes bacterium]|nr:DUF4395 domain-containing protein [Bacteroidota bacterium]
MKRELNISCPVSTKRVDENTVRVIAFLVLFVSSISIVLNNYFISAFLVVDFLVRGFELGEYSLLRLSAKSISKLLGLKKKPIDAAPKFFAAKVGFVFTLIVLISQLFSFPVLGISTGVVLIVCAFLESFLGVCLGCYFYTILNKVFLNRFHNVGL